MRKKWELGDFVARSASHNTHVGRIVLCGNARAMVIWQNLYGAIAFGDPTCRVSCHPLARLRRAKIAYDTRDDPKASIEGRPIIVTLGSDQGIEIVYMTRREYHQAVVRIQAR